MYKLILVNLLAVTFLCEAHLTLFKEPHIDDEYLITADSVNHLRNQFGKNNEAMNPGEVGRIWGFIAHSAAILETRKDGAPAQRQKVHFLLCHGPVQTSVPAPTNFAYREKSNIFQ